MIPLFDLTLPEELQLELERVTLGVLRSKAFILGETVERFEQAFADSVGASYAVGLNSGTDALVIGLRGLGIGPGDEVIVPALSFYASAEAVLLAGATPVLVDVDAHTLTLSLGAAEAAIGPKTAAIMPVHLYGYPVDMPELCKLAERRGLAIIEDAAQAAGASVAGRQVGSWGNAGCFSFYPTKNLGAAGDGGMLVTTDEALAERARSLREHGKAGAYYHNDVGYTSRLDALQAAILSAKLPYLPGWNAARRKHAQAYDRAFAGWAQTPAPHEGHVYHLYNLRLKNRDDVLKALQDKGVGARVYYPHALPELPPLSGTAHDAYPNALAATRELLSLPLHPNLTDEQRAVVTSSVLELLA